MSIFKLCLDEQHALLSVGLFLAMVLLLFLVICQISQEDRKVKFWCDTAAFLILFLTNIAWRVQNQMVIEGAAGEGIQRIAAGIICMAGFLYGLFRLVWLYCHQAETLSRDAIREGFDNLPMGIAFFDRTGFPTLINRRMHMLGMAMSGKEIQSKEELEKALLESDGKIQVISREPAVYAFSDGSVWKYSKEIVTTESREVFTQFLAVDVTALSASRQKLEQENEQLKEAGRLIRELSLRMVSITREEEILAMKVRVHDELGYNVQATHRALVLEKMPEELINNWKKTLLLLETKPDTEMGQNLFGAEEWFDIIEKRAKMLGLTLQLEGPFPKETKTGELILAGILECMTNSVRHGQATEMKVELSGESGCCQAVISNNGRIPEMHITEGGGLSGLRTRIKKEGGTMEVREKPVFSLIIRIPEGDRE